MPVGVGQLTKVDWTVLSNQCLQVSDSPDWNWSSACFIQNMLPPTTSPLSGLREVVGCGWISKAATSFSQHSSNSCGYLSTRDEQGHLILPDLHTGLGLNVEKLTAGYRGRSCTSEHHLTRRWNEGNISNNLTSGLMGDTSLFLTNRVKQQARFKTMATSQTGIKSPQSVRQLSCIPVLQLTRRPHCVGSLKANSRCCKQPNAAAFFLWGDFISFGGFWIGMHTLYSFTYQWCSWSGQFWHLIEKSVLKNKSKHSVCCSFVFFASRKEMFACDLWLGEIGIGTLQFY